MLGLFVTFSIIAMRMEMILYVRTINGVRRFFGDKDPGLVKFFTLSTSDKFPPFYEPWSAVFWQIVLTGVLDGLITGLGINNLFRTDWWVGLLIGSGYLAVHLIVYYLFAWKKDYEWKHGLKPAHLRQLKIGNLVFKFNWF